jgi:hypothetical protein
VEENLSRWIELGSNGDGMDKLGQQPFIAAMRYRKTHRCAVASTQSVFVKEQVSKNTRNHQARGQLLGSIGAIHYSEDDSHPGTEQHRSGSLRAVGGLNRHLKIWTDFEA